MKRDPTREGIEAIARAARSPEAPESLETIRRGLHARSNQLVARAARAVREARLESLAAEVAAAFPRLLVDPVARDPTCAAKLAVARCLLELEHAAPEAFLAGVRHVQREPAWGPPVDAAAELRATCALALVATGHPDGPFEAVRLLADPEPVARAGGLRALGACGLPGAELALRLHVLRGESEPGVLHEALSALLAIDFARSLPFVREALEGEDGSAARAAALALGDSRREGALAPLLARVGAERRPDVRHALVLALAALRLDGAFDALLFLVESGDPADSRAAQEALARHPGDRALQARLRDALGRRG